MNSEFDPIPEVRKWKNKASDELAGKTPLEIKRILSNTRKEFEKSGLKLMNYQNAATAETMMVRETNDDNE